MTPPRKAPAKKVTASRRTTAPRVKDPTFVDFDAARAKAKRGDKARVAKGTLKYQGRLWTLKRPNQILTQHLLEGIDGEDGVTVMKSYTDYLLAHVVLDEREEFVKALEADEDLDLDVMGDLTNLCTEAVYAGLPT